jgi:hypothetical protein
MCAWPSSNNTLERLRINNRKIICGMESSATFLCSYLNLNPNVLKMDKHMNAMLKNTSVHGVRGCPQDHHSQLKHGLCQQALTGLENLHQDFN